jgi:TRAP-type C4-dicarboxylate transport system permease small subunit
MAGSILNHNNTTMVLCSTQWLLTVPRMCCLTSTITCALLRVWLLVLWCSGWSHCHLGQSHWLEGWQMQQAVQGLALPLALVLRALSHLLQALQEVQAL